jgi:hypothetical protein
MVMVMVMVMVMMMVVVKFRFHNIPQKLLLWLFPLHFQQRERERERESNTRLSGNLHSCFETLRSPPVEGLWRVCTYTGRCSALIALQAAVAARRAYADSKSVIEDMTIYQYQYQIDMPQASSSRTFMNNISVRFVSLTQEARGQPWIANRKQRTIDVVIGSVHMPQASSLGTFANSRSEIEDDWCRYRISIPQACSSRAFTDSRSETKGDLCRYRIRLPFFT